LNFDDIILNGVNISSSGTTGTPKNIYRSPANIKVCVEVALKAQCINSDSSILTVTKLSHAGGLLLQTLPAHYVGARYDIIKFNPYSFISDLTNHTHTFITPQQTEALMKTKSFTKASFKGKFIAMGSGYVPASHINAFTSRGATVFQNWGMSEIGPCVINMTFEPYSDLINYDNIMGDTYWTEYKIVDDALWVKGPMCIYDGWFKTNDIVSIVGDKMFHRGRL